MSAWRIVVRHVGFWRGQVHKWSTVYPFAGSLSASNYQAVINAMEAHDRGICYSASGGETGGVYEVAIYNSATGGVPVANQQFFDPTNPSGWYGYTAAGWSTASGPAEGTLETALQLEWPAGLSKSGKPVIFRKWYHAVPQSASNAGQAQVTPANQASLATFSQDQIAIVQGFGILLGNASRLAASTPRVLPYYGNHQMMRGRRKKKSSTNVPNSDLQAILDYIDAGVGGLVGA